MKGTKATHLQDGLLTAHQVVIEPDRGWFDLQWRAVWQYRELLYLLVWRDVKVRYKQTALGVTWIVIQPLVSMVVFSGLFGLLLQVPSGGVPYPVFVLAGLLPWQYFANSLNRCTNSLVDSSYLITKVYFPRVIIPLAAVISGLVDFGVSFVAMLVVLLLFGIYPTPAIVLLPFFLLLALATALGFGLWLTALNVRFRDVRQLLPFIVQIWMYVTPVVYSLTLIPERYRWLFALNPMSGVVGGFRWALLGDHLTDVQDFGPLFVASVAITVLVLVTGAFFFRRIERTFADII
jgi:lipopolysaccharide transport system permease protein